MGDGRGSRCGRHGDDGLRVGLGAGALLVLAGIAGLAFGTAAYGAVTVDVVAFGGIRTTEVFEGGVVLAVRVLVRVATVLSKGSGGEESEEQDAR